MNEKKLEKIMKSAEEALMYFGLIYLLFPLSCNKITQAVWFFTFFTISLLKRIFRPKSHNKHNPF